MSPESALQQPPVQISIPYAPRQWAVGLHESFRRMAVLVLHRRAGKTTAILNHHQRAAMDDIWESNRLRYLQPGITDAEIQELLQERYYWHVMPTRVQAKQVAWDMIKRFAKPIPGVKFNEAELLVRYPNGSKLQLIGADNPDVKRGPGLSGASFDEWSQQPQEIYTEVVSKALGDHAGYAIWAGTIKGKDQLYEAYDKGKDDPNWFTLWQDIDKSLATESGITVQLLESAMAADRDQIAKGLMTQAEYDQEWYLSPEAAIKGAFYLTEMALASKEGRIGRVPYDPAMPVDTDWDLGVDDSTAIWFSQSYRTREIRLIDYYEASGEGFPHYVKILREKPYVYGKHYPPHDIAARELGTGVSRKETAARLGLKFEDPGAKLALADGIDAVRRVLGSCWFDQMKCAVGIEALRQYRKQFNIRMNEFTGTPIHNRFSHGADSFRTLAVRYKPPEAKKAARLANWARRSQSGTDWMRG